MMNGAQDDVYVCPSFNSYSGNRLAEIAARVSVEKSNDAAESLGNEADDDFEFSLVRDENEVYAEAFSDGQIGVIYPVFNRDLLLNDDSEVSTSGEKVDTESSIMVPLSKLFIEEDQDRDCPHSCSSSEADELENVPAGTYCVWRPKMADSPMPNQCKKSKSTGSVSKRWKFRDLMRRSNSDGKNSFVFLTPKHSDENSEKLIRASKKSKGKGVSAAAASAAGGATVSPSAHEAFYVRNRAMKEGDKKKSYLPYRQDLVGFFANVNGLRRSLPHF